MEIEWRPARWLGSSAEVTLTHSFIQALHRSTGRLFAPAWAAEAAGQNEGAVRGARPGSPGDNLRSTRAHHAHPRLAAHKPSAHACVRLPWIHAAAAVKMGAQRPLVGDVRAIDWRGAGHPPQPLAR